MFTAVCLRFWRWIVTAIAVLVAIAAIYFRGRSSGKEVEQKKATERDLTEAKKYAETIRETSDAQAEVSRLPDSDVRQRLRDKWQRD
jgi:uncharacterized membrane-anchored protein YhcB (DUF1043 family)